MPPRRPPTTPIQRLPPPPPCPVAETLTEAGLAPFMLCYRLDQGTGLALVEGEAGRLGLLHWKTASAHENVEALLGAITWGALEQLVPMAEEAERELGFNAVPDVPLISRELREMLLARR